MRLYKIVLVPANTHLHNKVEVTVEIRPNKITVLGLVVRKIRMDFFSKYRVNLKTRTWRSKIILVLKSSRDYRIKKFPRICLLVSILDKI